MSCPYCGVSADLLGEVDGVEWFQCQGEKGHVYAVPQHPVGDHIPDELLDEVTFMPDGGGGDDETE